MCSTDSQEDNGAHLFRLSTSICGVISPRNTSMHICASRTYDDLILKFKKFCYSIVVYCLHLVKWHLQKHNTVFHLSARFGL